MRLSSLALPVLLLAACEPPRRVAEPTPPPPVPFLSPSAIGAVTLSNEDLCVLLVNGGVLCRRDFRPKDATTHPASFVPVFPEGDVQEVALGGAHGCVRRLNGTVQCWGENENGEVSGDELVVPWPRVVPISGAVAQIALGRDKTCALLIDGRVTCWGSFVGVRRPPTQLPVLADVVELRMSGPSLCLRTKDGTVRCGRGDSALFAVEGVEGALQLVVGEEHACARVSGGRVACWSIRKEDVGPTKTSLHARSIEGATEVVQLASGDDHVCARRGDRTVLCWGGNDYGELGDGTRTPRATPAPVAKLSNVVDLAAGGHRSCARRESGTVVCWGRNLLDDAMFHALTGLQSPPGPPGDDDSLVPEPLRVPGALQVAGAEG